MADERIDLRSLELREVFPWLHLFRGLGIALDAKKIVLGGLGAFLMVIGWTAILWVLGGDPAESKQFATLRQSPWNPDQAPLIDVYRSPLTTGGVTPIGVPTSFFLVLEPLRLILEPARVMFTSEKGTWPGILLVIWTLLVWALAGGAITRIAAVQFARDGHVGLIEAVRFAVARIPSYVGATVAPFVGVVVIVCLCAFGGLLTRAPILDIVMGLIWFLSLGAGLLMALALFGLALGWPLMCAAVSTEATEGFDALSRAYSYLLGRTWRYFFYSVVAILYGGIIMVFVALFAHATLSLSQYAVAWGAGGENLEQLYAFMPSAGGWKAEFGATETPPTGTRYLAAGFVCMWTHLFFLAVLGFAFSYFWSATTIVYFLLRRDVDEGELDEVYLEEEEEEPFPTVAPSLSPPSPAESPRATDGEPPARGGSEGDAETKA